MKTLLPVAVAAMVASATSAAAETPFASMWLIPGKAQVLFDLVSADAKGVVEIYDYRSGRMGAMLGSQAVVPGDNPELRVGLEPPHFHDVMVVLTVGDTVTARETVVFHRQGR